MNKEKKQEHLFNKATIFLNFQTGKPGATWKQER